MHSKSIIAKNLNHTTQCAICVIDKKESLERKWLNQVFYLIYDISFEL